MGKPCNSSEVATTPKDAASQNELLVAMTKAEGSISQIFTKCIKDHHEGPFLQQFLLAQDREVHHQVMMLSLVHTLHCLFEPHGMPQLWHFCHEC